MQHALQRVRKSAVSATSASSSSSTTTIATSTTLLSSVVVHSEDSEDSIIASGSDHDVAKKNMSRFASCYCMSSVRITVLLILCLQNSLFTVLRRYSQGVLKENYSKYEVLLVGEIIKMVFSAYMIKEANTEEGRNHYHRLWYLVSTSRKMVALALIYGAMNILSFVSLRNIGAGMFTIFAQCKIMTTAVCSTLILRRQYSWTKWRALISLVFGVLLFSEPIWGNASNMTADSEDASPMLGTIAVLIEVTLSGFASIYFEKVIKTDPLQLTIWERNFQLALGSVPVYLAFMLADGGGTLGYFHGWSFVAFVVAMLGAAGGLLVALSIKYGDSILKTLATTGAIVLSSVLDHLLLNGPLTPTMMIAGVQVIVAICNYTFDVSPEPNGKGEADTVSNHPSGSTNQNSSDEEVALVEKR